MHDTTMAMRVETEPFTSNEAVDDLDARLADDPTSVELRFMRACALHDLGRAGEAERAYLDVLAREETHFGALTNLGTLLHVGGRHDVARAFYTKALVHHPNEPIAYINVGNTLAEAGQMRAAIQTYEGAFAVRPGYPNAHFALSLLYRQLGDDKDADIQHQLAFAKPIVAVTPPLGPGPSIDMLLLKAANGGNVVVPPLIDRNRVRQYKITVEGYRDDMRLPAHHVVFNGVGDADRSAAALEVAERIVARSGAPSINRPSAVLDTGRRAITERLGALPGVRCARIEAFARDDVTVERLAAAGFTFPVLLRSPGYHTGAHFESIETAADLAPAVERLPGKSLLAIAFLDGRGADGNFRKYRVMFIGGRLYPLHLAISRQWKVHYFSADMGIAAEYRDEEAAFLNDMASALGLTVVRLLETIAATLALDYGGIDFGVDAAGNVLVYEANATMVILPPPPDERFGYRLPAVLAAVFAARALIAERAEAGGYARA